MIPEEAHTERHAEYRQITADIRATSRELAQLKQDIKLHPLKPRGGAQPDREWRKVKYLFHREREDLLEQLDDLHEAREQAMSGLRDDPFPIYGLTFVLEKLAAIEADLADGDSEAAWDRTTKLMDWLEEDENRIYEIQEEQK